MRMHDVITCHPAWRKIADAKAMNRKAQARNNQRATAVSGERERILAAHARAVAEAVLDAQEPPSPPQLAPADPALDGMARLLMERQQELDEQERRLLANLSNSFERQLAEREQQLFDEARPLVASLQALAAELGSIEESVAIVREANGDQRRTAGGQITAARVAEVVTANGSFLRSGPATQTSIPYSASHAADDDGDGIAFFTPEDAPRPAPPSLLGRR